MFKYSLSAESLSVDGEMRPYVHIYVMQSVTKDKLDLLLADLRQSAAFEFEPLRASEKAPGKLAKVERLVHVPHHGRGFR